jgi:hypothetical protein
MQYIIIHVNTYDNTYMHYIHDISCVNDHKNTIHAWYEWTKLQQNYQTNQRNYAIKHHISRIHAYNDHQHTMHEQYQRNKLANW